MYLLIAGDNYYPQAYTGNWIKCFTSYSDARDVVIDVGHKYKIYENMYDWFDIVNLNEWIVT